ncbi:Transamidase GatB domain protein [hydrothermal vent metagenome]|uniref:Transamidase GatB domain protein n=1 Tax=hydrothermal vent metagenome TaxID=652676 RepID=A0A3B0WDD4_9ZZZZ
MNQQTLKQQLTDDMKASMKGGKKKRLGVIRLVLAAIKQIEVDERIELDNARVLAVLDKMVKQRRESISQFKDAGRDDLWEQEEFEVAILQDFLPEALSDTEIDQLIAKAVSDTGASSIKDMGKVMGILKPQMQGRADMGAVSGKIKAQLNA